MERKAADLDNNFAIIRLKNYHRKKVNPSQEDTMKLVGKGEYVNNYEGEDERSGYSFNIYDEFFRWFPGIKVFPLNLRKFYISEESVRKVEKEEGEKLGLRIDDYNICILTFILIVLVPTFGLIRSSQCSHCSEKVRSQNNSTQTHQSGKI